AHIVWGSLNEISAILPKTLKGMAVRAKPPVATPAATDIHTRPEPKSQTNKNARHKPGVLY
ncbi:hypothetical protein, partial [Pseudomonas sp. AKS31]|uniref:hypothetical protein n=1 Tax=Pseudomonas sp. AKS31 TaxID=2949091 RepID=UPI00202A84E3